MNKRCEYGLLGWIEHPYESKRTLTDMQNEMKKLNADIVALDNMEIDFKIKTYAIDELFEKKRVLLSEMHSEIDRMYG